VKRYETEFFGEKEIESIMESLTIKQHTMNISNPDSMKD